MSGIQMIADKRQNYNQVAIRVGDTFSVNNEIDAEDLVAMQFAHRVKSSPVTRPTARILSRNMEAADAPTSNTLPVDSTSTSTGVIESSSTLEASPEDAETGEQKREKDRAEREQRIQEANAQVRQTAYNRRDIRAKR